ncbi:unnamed protein product, partial [Prorocentrum cordatum]
MQDEVQFDIPGDREVTASSLHAQGGQLRDILCPLQPALRRDEHACVDQVELESVADELEAVDVPAPPSMRGRRNLLPLPSGEVREVPVARRGGAGERELVQAMPESNDWLSLVIVGLNFHCALRGRSPRLAPSLGGPAAVQTSAARFLTEEARVFLDQCGGELPEIDWGAEVKASAVSYTGEEVYSSEPLNLERLVEALPPASAASSVDVLSVCEGWVHQALLGPSRVLQAEDDVEVMPRAPRVWASASEWGRIAAVPVERKVLGGMFGVHKGGYKRGEGPQRLVMNMTPSRAIQKVIQCGVPLLPSSEKWRSVALRPYFALWLPARRQALGLLSCEGSVYLTSTVVPTGWVSATGVTQHVRRCRLRRWRADVPALPADREFRRDVPVPGRGGVLVPGGPAAVSAALASDVQLPPRSCARPDGPADSVADRDDVRGDVSVPGGPAVASSVGAFGSRQPPQTLERPGGPAGSAGRPRRGQVGSPPLAGWRDIYIGCGSQHLELEASVWGNPFRLEVDGGRWEVIAKFGMWLRSQPRLVARMPELSGCRLLCHCRESQGCHGGEIIELWDEMCTPGPGGEAQPARTENQCWLAWQVYLDSLDMLEVGPAVEMELLKLAGRPEAMWAALERCEALGVPVSEAKAVVRDSEATALGDFVNGEQGAIWPPGEFCHRVAALTLYTLRRQRVAQKWMQVLAGRWVRMMLYRRETMTCCGEFWKFLVRMRGERALPDAVRRELVSALCLMPLMRCDLRVDEEAARVARHSWPDVMELGDVASIARTCLERVRERAPMIQRIVRLASEVVGEGCRVFRIIENVASMDQEPLDTMSSELDLGPVFVDGAVFPHCHRDRVYWVDQHVMVPLQLAEVRPERGGVRVVPRETPGSQEANCLAEPNGELRKPDALERELLLDFPPRHTVTARPTMARKEVPTLGAMRFTGGACAIAEGDVVMEGDFRVHDDGEQEARTGERDLVSREAALGPSVALIEGLSRRAEARGSDVRLDALESMSPLAWCGAAREHCIGDYGRYWCRDDIALLLIVGFSGFLRTTVMVSLRRWHIQIALDRSSVVIPLPITKSGPRWHVEDSVVISDRGFAHFCEHVLGHLQPGDQVLQGSVANSRLVFDSLLDGLG